MQIIIFSGNLPHKIMGILCKNLYSSAFPFIYCSARRSFRSFSFFSKRLKFLFVFYIFSFFLV